MHLNITMSIVIQEERCFFYISQDRCSETRRTVLLPEILTC